VPKRVTLVEQHGATRSSRRARQARLAQHVFRGVATACTGVDMSTSLFPKVVPEIDAVSRWRISQTCLLTQLCFYLLVVFIVSCVLTGSAFNVNSSSTRFCQIYVRFDTGRLPITFELLVIFDLRYSSFRGRVRYSAAMLLAVMLLLIELCPLIGSATTPVGSTAVTLECRASITVSLSLLNAVHRRLLFNADKSPIFTPRNSRSIMRSEEHCH